MQLELGLKCCMHVLMILSLCVWLKSVWSWKNGEFLGKLLQKEDISLKSMKKELLQNDRMLSVENARTEPP